MIILVFLLLLMISTTPPQFLTSHPVYPKHIPVCLVILKRAQEGQILRQLNRIEDGQTTIIVLFFVLTICHVTLEMSKRH